MIKMDKTQAKTKVNHVATCTMYFNYCFVYIDLT